MGRDYLKLKTERRKNGKLQHTSSSYSIEIQGHITRFPKYVELMEKRLLQLVVIRQLMQQEKK